MHYKHTNKGQANNIKKNIQRKQKSQQWGTKQPENKMKLNAQMVSNNERLSFSVENKIK